MSFIEPDGELASAIQEIVRLNAELARLREELQGYRNQKFKTDYEDENARLREALEEIGELGKYEERVCEEPWNVARNALKETT